MARNEHGLWCCCQCRRTVREGAQFTFSSRTLRVQSYCRECNIAYQRRWQRGEITPRKPRRYSSERLARLTAAYEKHFKR